MEPNEIPADALARQDAQTGSCFEVSMRFPRGVEDDMAKAHAVLWSHAALHGPFTSGDVDPRTAPVARGLGWTDRSVGVARLPTGHIAACVTFGYEPDREAAEGPCLELSVFDGALRSVYDIGPWPFDDGRQHAWVLELSAWFSEIALSVHEVVPFEGASIGCEVGCEEIVRSAAALPSPRWVGYLVPDGERIAWFPPEVLKGPFGFDPPGTK